MEKKGNCCFFSFFSVVLVFVICINENKVFCICVLLLVEKYIRG